MSISTITVMIGGEEATLAVPSNEASGLVLSDGLLWIHEKQISIERPDPWFLVACDIALCEFDRAIDRIKEQKLDATRELLEETALALCAERWRCVRAKLEKELKEAKWI